ncbi:MAG: glutathione S-transferase family protein [Planctomycetota bacterium]|nr:MAG: glutathione S-transferase family protein [Planctomycetota bacterium]
MLILHELTPSPNSVKIRLALGFKGLDYERRPLVMEEFPGDRSHLVACSRQPLTPVLEHDQTRIFDSSAILRYLEANFPDRPALFSEEIPVMREIEAWEFFARTELLEPVGMVFEQAFLPEPDPEVLQQARERLHALTERIEKRLSGAPYLAAERMTAADVVAAPVVHLGTMEVEQVQESPIRSFFAQHFQLQDHRSATRTWVERVMAHDPVYGRQQTAS